MNIKINLSKNKTISVYLINYKIISVIIKQLFVCKGIRGINEL